MGLMNYGSDEGERSFGIEKSIPGTQAAVMRLCMKIGRNVCIWLRLQKAVTLNVTRYGCTYPILRFVSFHCFLLQTLEYLYSSDLISTTSDAQNS